jgi:Spy/CpxP family protein refolding chaperone
MKTLVRLIGVCSLATVGVVATPSIAIADSSARGGETIGTTTEAMHMGARKLFKRALHETQLRPEQKSEVDKLIAEAEKRHEPVKKAKREFMMALADQIDSGKIDRCKLAPQIKALADAMAEAHPGDRDAFEELHSILDPEQRVRFVDALKEQWESAKKAHSTEAIVHKMSRELNLSDDQKSKLREVIGALKKIRDAEPAHQEHRARWARMLEAFKGEHFDLDEIAPMKDVAEMRTKRIEARLWAAEAVLPILNEEQRSLIAKKVRDKAQGHIETERGTKTAQGKESGKEQEAKEQEDEDEAAEERKGKNEEAEEQKGKSEEAEEAEEAED